MCRSRIWHDLSQLGLEPPDPRRAVVSALTIAGAYIVGGCIPLGPYMLLATASAALGASVALTLMALGVFGYVKEHFTGTPPWRSAIQTVRVPWRSIPDRRSAAATRRGADTVGPGCGSWLFLSAHALSLLGFGGLMERQGRTNLLCVDRCEKAAALLNVATEMPQRRTTIHAAQQETRNGLQWQG